MALCLQCNKWLNQTAGKRAKRFCNSTCRSNYWYGKKYKGGIRLEPPQTQYDGPKLPSNFVADEPLSFDKLKEEAVIKEPKSDFESRLYAAECGEDLQLLGMEIDRSGLPRFEKQRLHTIGQRIYNDKFNF